MLLLWANICAFQKKLIDLSSQAADNTATTDIDKKEKLDNSKQAEDSDDEPEEVQAAGHWVAISFASFYHAFLTSYSCGAKE